MSALILGRGRRRREPLHIGRISVNENNTDINPKLVPDSSSDDTTDNGKGFRRKSIRQDMNLNGKINDEVICLVDNVPLLLSHEKKGSRTATAVIDWRRKEKWHYHNIHRQILEKQYDDDNLNNDYNDSGIPAKNHNDDERSGNKRNFVSMEYGRMEKVEQSFDDYISGNNNECSVVVTAGRESGHHHCQRHRHHHQRKVSLRSSDKKHNKDKQKENMEGENDDEVMKLEQFQVVAEFPEKEQRGIGTDRKTMFYHYQDCSLLLDEGSRMMYIQDKVISADGSEPVSNCQCECEGRTSSGIDGCAWGGSQTHKIPSTQMKVESGNDVQEEVEEEEEGNNEKKSNSKSSLLCDNSITKKLSEKKMLGRGKILVEFLKRILWTCRSSSQSSWSAGRVSPTSNVFKLFNLVLVLFCLLTILSCHRVNCAEVGQRLTSGTGITPSTHQNGTDYNVEEKVEKNQSIHVDEGFGKNPGKDYVSAQMISKGRYNVSSLSLFNASIDLVHRTDVDMDGLATEHEVEKRSAVSRDSGDLAGELLSSAVNGSVMESRDENKLVQFSTSNSNSDSFDSDKYNGEGVVAGTKLPRKGKRSSNTSNKNQPLETDDIRSHQNNNSVSTSSASAETTSSHYRYRQHILQEMEMRKKDGKDIMMESSSFEKMSADQPQLGKGRFFKNMSSSSTPNKRGSRSVCRLSEFVCKGGKCITADKFCDGIDDCADGSPSSDEPRFCTPCNRTYYGELGSTYHISLSSETIAAALGLNHPQQLDPSSAQGGGGHGGPAQFVCHLTFFAAGDNFGDLVQLMFDSVNIGQFVSSVIDGCPEGSLQVAEISRPITGGQWCGSGAGFSVYFSEMSTITLTLIVGGPNLAHPSKSLAAQNTSLAQVVRPIDAFPGSPRSGPVLPGSHQSPPMVPPPPPPEFDFKLRYKFIPQGLAAVRYGTLGSPVERGQLEPGTYCNRILEQCHRRRCKIQSPNYPGLYPRNVSCFFTVLQRDKPQCKRVLVQVSQSRSHKVQLRSLLPGPQMSLASGLVMSPGIAANDPTASMAVDTFMAWEDCNWSRDRIVIYDGNNTDARVLLSICGGSHIPPVTSSGPEIHIAFYSTPFGNPLGPVPPPPFPAPLRGFELDIDVVLVDSESADYSNTPNCTFYFVSSKAGVKGHRGMKLQQEGGNWIAGVTGTVRSPRHTLPPNTTCRYEFKGAENEAIWIYFVSYRRDSVKDAKRLPEGNCTTRLTIRDGLLGHGQPRALLGSFCDSELPKLCEHKALQNETRLVRACTTNESYISAGASIIVEQQFLEGTALRPLHYKFHYEFVNRHPAGMEGACSRHFHFGKIKSKKGTIRTSDNIFDFGRGGRRNLTCTYTFTMGTHDGLKLTVLRSSFGDRPCRTQTDLETGRYVCNYFVPPVPTTKSTGAGGQPPTAQNDTVNMLANNTAYPTHHPFFAADHPGGNYTGGTSGTNHHHSHQQQHNFPKSELVLEEYIWPGVNISSHRNCICSNSSRSTGYSWTFLGRKVQLTFNVENMKGQDGYENFFVEIEYEVLKGEGCRGDNHYMKTESGLISLESYFSYGPRDKPPTCDHYPWLLEAKENHSLYLRIPGFAMLEEKKTRGNQHPKVQGLTLHNLTGALKELEGNNNKDGEHPYLSLPFTANSLMNTTATAATKPSSTLTGSAIFQLDRICPTTKNRIFVYDRENRLVQKICPSSNHQMSKKNIQVVELYSEEFYQYTSPLYPPPKPRFIIEFVGRELGTYRLNWLEVMSARMKTTLKALQTDFVGRATIAGRGLGANYSDIYKKELQKITSSWDDTLTAMFEGQNGYDPMGQPPPVNGGVDSVHLVDERPPTPPPVCSSYCPELRACISEKLWCDGEIHCPVTKMDEISCDSFWLTLGQLMSPAVYVPLLAAVVSALCCCVLVMLCVGVKKMILSSRFKRHHHHHHHHRAGSADGRSSMGSSCTSTVDRRTLPPRDWTLDPHDPLS